MTNQDFASEIGRYVWDAKYRFRPDDGVPEDSIQDTWRRVAKALAAVEADRQEAWENAFYRALEGFRFLPAGRILAGAGTGRRVTLFNCFVMGRIHDSMESIFENLQEAAITMQQGGGIGYDFSTLRPRGSKAHAAGTVASGPVSFMDIWDAMCATVLSTGARRGAMMATLRCDHPDIEEFVEAKQTAGRLRNFNLSVQVTDAFVQAVRDDAAWPLVFPEESLEDNGGGETVERLWPGFGPETPCRVLRRIPARQLWERIMRATYDYAEPGVLFVDQVNRMNNLRDREYISATNPCGEVPLPPYGGCDLGSINLAAFITDPYGLAAALDIAGIREITGTAVRMLDDVIDASRFPLEAQAKVIRGNRRIGLGITGLADALIMLGITYGSEDALETAATAMREICHAAYRVSIELAKEKGSFPDFQAETFLSAPFPQDLPDDIRDGIRRHGLRNSHLISIAPAGTISLLADNVSSGLEPVFAFSQTRNILQADGSTRQFHLANHAWRLWREAHPNGEDPPAAFVGACDVPVKAHLETQAALQPYVDNAISKTINVPRDFSYEGFKDVYLEAHARGLKGCTTFRANPVTGEILQDAEAALAAPHCCTLEREAD